MQGGNATPGSPIAFVGAVTYQAAVSPSISQGKPVPGVLIPRSASLRMAAFFYPLPFDYSKAFSLYLLADICLKEFLFYSFLCVYFLDTVM